MAKAILEETQDAAVGLDLAYEKITSHKPEPKRLELMKLALDEFSELYSNDQDLTESLTPELSTERFDKRVEVAAWTMMTHSLLNLELAKVRR